MPSTEDIDRAIRRGNLRMAWRLRYGWAPEDLDKLYAAIREEFGLEPHEAMKDLN